MTEQPTTDTTTGPEAPPPPAATVADLWQAVTAMLDSRLMCLGCVADNRRAALAGTRDDQLPPVNIAQVIVKGDGQCLGHVQFVDGPLMPGQTPSGIYLPGQPA